MSNAIKIEGLYKTYESGFKALNNINLQIKKGEIFALLGPNGAGKSSLINIICGIVNATSGSIHVNDYDIIKDYRKTRSLIGLVPQELTTDAFIKVFHTVAFSRGLFGLPKDKKYISKILKDLSLWDKRNDRVQDLSGGMKRRLLMAKALSHNPSILFLDEPTAGVDVELRKSMWEALKSYRDSERTIILTTHYIEEAEQLADRIGIINNGEIVLVEDKDKIVQKLGEKRLVIQLANNLSHIPSQLSDYQLDLSPDGGKLIFVYDSFSTSSGINNLLSTLNSLSIKIKDIDTEESSLEDIFVKLLRESR
ncbi:MAG: multidrug ABC transporter ATP-binding protein [Gammaproteobacteria bacterium TMED78]|nr:MAG: multidrug ABC transporter ATP-binding protein [Gammaproteobacteria bacterium TMED78]